MNAEQIIAALGAIREGATFLPDGSVNIDRTTYNNLVKLLKELHNTKE